MKAELLVGATVGAAPEQVLLERDVLTTHGVILGMTGSGKTGLAVVLLEELARKGVPLVICDLKGDMTNLLLNFPTLAAGDFAPYLPATQAGVTLSGETFIPYHRIRTVRRGGEELWRARKKRGDNEG